MPAVNLVCVEVDKAATPRRIELSGVLDTSTVGEFDALMRAIHDDGVDAVMLLMGGLSYVSSAGIGALMDWTQRLAARGGGGLTLVAPTPKVAGILDLLGLSAIFRIVDSEERALEELDGIQGQ